MAKTKLKFKSKKLVPQEIRTVEADKVTLPAQAVEEVQLINMDTQILMELAKPNDFRDIVRAAKSTFVKEIQELSARAGLEAEVKIYFSFKLKE